jgi:hypothetical protein
LRRTLILLTLIPAGVLAQAPVPGDCELGRAEADIDVGDVFARVFNTGSLFFGNTSQAHYLVPRQTGRTPIFAAGFWVGGLVGGELRVAGSTYDQFEFWPGPIDPTTGRPPNPGDCSGYDRIWRVSRGDLEHYYRTGEARDDLAEWPYQLGAPVFDGDGDPTNYDLAAGDQPALSGDQTLWWVMNDMGNVHGNTLVPAIGLEAQVTAFGFADGPTALRQATFYRLRIANRGPETFENAYLSFFADPDLGDASDDWVGSDTLREFGYVYNGDNQDGSGTGGTYGAGPPAFGVRVVQGPVTLPNGRDDDGDGEIDEPGERVGMSAFMSYVGGAPFPTRDPANGAQMYQGMQGRWNDGSPVTLGGYGYNPGSALITTFMFPGDPVTNRFWSERCPGNPANCGNSNTPNDRRFVMTTGPFELAAGADDDILLGLIFGQGADNFDSVTALRVASTVTRSAYEAGLLDPRPVPGFAGPPPPPAAVQIRRPVPNPFGERATIGVSLPSAATLRIALVDVLGREVAVLADGPREAGRHDVAIDGATLRPSVYVARVWVDGQPAAALPVTRR